VKYAFVAAHRRLFPVRTMCRCLRIQPSGFYAWLKTPLSKRAKEDIRQTELIRKAWKDSGKVYGYPLAGRQLRSKCREAQTA
jgi:putative transposase